jgi:predicted amidohydrolase
VDECFTPLSAYTRRVEEVREKLQRARGIEVQRVVLMSDETNATWWEEVAAYRWHRVDHSTMVETHSWWHSVLIDAAIQDSTFENP